MRYLKIYSTMTDYKIYPCEPLVSNGPLADPFGISIQEDNARYVAWLAQGNSPDVTTCNRDITIINDLPTSTPYVPPVEWNMELPDGNRIVGNGVDSVPLVITTNQNTVSSVDVVIESITYTINLEMGRGEMEISSTSPPGIILVEGAASGPLNGKSVQIHVAAGA